MKKYITYFLFLCLLTCMPVLFSCVEKVKSYIEIVEGDDHEAFLQLVFDNEYADKRFSCEESKLIQKHLLAGVSELGGYIVKDSALISRIVCNTLDSIKPYMKYEFVSQITQGAFYRLEEFDREYIKMVSQVIDDWKINGRTRSRWPSLP